MHANTIHTWNTIIIAIARATKCINDTIVNKHIWLLIVTHRYYNIYYVIHV